MLYKEFEKNREDILENEFACNLMHQHCPLQIALLIPLYVLLESVYKEMLK